MGTVGRRSFATLSLASLVTAGCDPVSTSDCTQLPDGNAAFECVRGAMFGAVGRGALLGAVAGALLGGAVSFVFTRNPVPGLVAGAIVGGVAGGIIAYYNFVTSRARGNVGRALDDVGQDAVADARKSLRLAETSNRGTDDLMRAILNKRQPIQDVVTLVNEQADLRQAAVVGLSQVQQVYRGATDKLLNSSGRLPLDRGAFSEFATDLNDSLHGMTSAITGITGDIRDLRDIGFKLNGRLEGAPN